MKIIVITASKWELKDATKEWRLFEWPVKLFHERDKAFADLWIKLRMEGFEWGKEHNTQTFYSMCDLDLNYV